MKRSEILLMLMRLPVDYAMLLLAGLSAYHLRFSEWAVQLKPVEFGLTSSDFLVLVSIVALGWMVIFAITGLYSVDPNRKFSKELVGVLVACAAGLAAVAVYILFTQQLFDSRFLVAAGWGFATVYVMVGRLFLRALKGLMYRAGIGLRRVVIIGDDDMTKHIAAELKKRPELGYKVVKMFKQFSKSEAPKIKKLRVSEMLFTNPRAREKEAIAALTFCNVNHITFKYSADVFATYSANMSVQPLAGIPVVELKKTPLDGWGRISKRAFDIVMSMALIIVSSPIMLITAFVILLETGRPIIFKNKRVGIRGKKFLTLKFRSMYKKDSVGLGGKKALEQEKKLIKQQSAKKGPIYKVADDPRVTPFGRFIRRWSLDEFPQFFNVLKGEMSIVGPRPHQPREVEQYAEDYPIVFTLKPGITGLAQISGRSDLSFEEEMRLDILYTERWSLMLDAIIFIKTPFILLKRRDVY